MNGFDTKESFELQYQLYYEPLCRFAQRYLDSENESRDLVQDLYVDIWVNRKKIKINSSIKAYLFIAVRNRSLSKLKSKLGIVPLTDSHVGEFTILPPNSDYPALEAAIHQAIDALPEKCKAIFELSREHGLKYSQIAEKFNISEKTVENQIGIALSRLRKVIKHFFPVILF
jgi:RNA polymerase sigma-70 factor (ECF subfamily)